MISVFDGLRLALICEKMEPTPPPPNEAIEATPLSDQDKVSALSLLCDVALIERRRFD